MLFAVHIRTLAPDHRVDLDELSAHGAAHLVSSGLDAVVRVRGPRGEVITPRGVRCHADQRGVSIGAEVEAPSARVAEIALDLTVRRLLAEHAEFVGWSVASCRASPCGVPPKPEG